MPALLLYLLSGLLLGFLLLPETRAAVKLYLGLVIGCVELMWLPCLWAFAFGFTMKAQLFALFTALLLGLSAGFLILRPLKCLPVRQTEPFSRRDWLGLASTLLLLLLCGYLLHTHVLRPFPDGSLHVGQSTYGDLAMHLGFIESLYQQGQFPPDYSIFPGQQLNYPFLVDAASASLRFFGLSLRSSVIWPSLVLLFCVFFGFWLLAEKLTGKTGPTLLSLALFAFNGGFGFTLFLKKYPFSDIFTQFYHTPTNYTVEDIRWVNVICDMLIPQRTTMAGWAVLLGCIWLLWQGVEKAREGGGRREICVLAVLASAMPMIHTHSFLALGILSAVWFFCALPGAVKKGHGKKLFYSFVIYGLVILALALPQVLKWTMDSVSTGRLLKLHLWWVVGVNGAMTKVLPFYLVNVGVVFLCLLPMLFFLRGEKLRFFLGAAAIFVLSNLVTFQPNLYDNNKLLYVWYMLTDILVCSWVWELLAKLKPRALRASLAAVFLFLGIFSGALSLVREAISSYQLFSREQVAAADYITESTEPGALFLTGTNHTNPVSVLAGRSIVCGPDLYLYFHGVDTSARKKDVAEMYKGGESFFALAEEYGVSYVYISSYERGAYELDETWFEENLELVFLRGDVSVYRLR